MEATVWIPIALSCVMAIIAIITLAKNSKKDTEKEAEARASMNADLKYSAGLLDREAYLRQEQSWLDCSASYDAAQLALTNALDTYDWAVAGSVSLR